MELIALLASIFVLGFIGGSIPGPILTSAFTETVREGFVKSLRVVLFALLSEVIVASAILFLPSHSIFPKLFSMPSHLLEQSFWYGLHGKFGELKNSMTKANYLISKKYFFLHFSMVRVDFLDTICVPQAYILSKKIAAGQLIFLLVFELGWLSATLLLTFLFSRFRPLLTKEGIVSKVFKFFALILLLFAIRLVITSVTYFIK